MQRCTKCKQDFNIPTGIETLAPPSPLARGGDGRHLVCNGKLNGALKEWYATCQLLCAGVSGIAGLVLGVRMITLIHSKWTRALLGGATGSVAGRLLFSQRIQPKVKGWYQERYGDKLRTPTPKEVHVHGGSALDGERRLQAPQLAVVAHS